MSYDPDYNPFNAIAADREAFYRTYPRRGTSPRTTVVAPSVHQLANQAVVDRFRVELMKLQLAHLTLQTSVDAQAKHSASCTILRAMRGS